MDEMYLHKEFTQSLGPPGLLNSTLELQLTASIDKCVENKIKISQSKLQRELHAATPASTAAATATATGWL